MLTDERRPVVLVHGWRSHPGIWNHLAPALQDAGLHCWKFDHTAIHESGTEAIALALQEFIHKRRKETSYSGPVDIVCHSMGTCIARYLLEVIDGSDREEEIRFLVGIGPPNRGSAMAEAFNDPKLGPEVIRRLAGIFVPHGYDPGEDLIVQEFRPGSRVTSALSRAGTRDDIVYRFILGANLTRTPTFFPAFGGMTLEFAPGGGWRTTYAGDGIVPHSDSYLPGADVDILPADSGNLARHPERYCHIMLPRNPEVVARVRDCLTASAAPGVRTPPRS
ncbi:alpha/beta fold hydrolase [Methanoculleus sp.]|uniref:esterase/lipase family protein n=1 Tax=Methanoculleus sp. TaxID=90427 RepID=UPI0026384EA3|nr:alpha/beta fold hydrolase [Methanoculleus sp.]MDI6866079.1 alpha/beta fold hydrolase [Methanoculleus sp.]